MRLKTATARRRRTTVAIISPTTLLLNKWHNRRQPTIRQYVIQKLTSAHVIAQGPNRLEKERDPRYTLYYGTTRPRIPDIIVLSYQNATTNKFDRTSIDTKDRTSPLSFIIVFRREKTFFVGSC